MTKNTDVEKGGCILSLSTHITSAKMKGISQLREIIKRKNVLVERMKKLRLKSLEKCF